MTSKKHWFIFTLLPFLLLLGFGFLILGLVLVHTKREMPFEVYIMFTVFSSLPISLGAFSLFNLKDIEIGEDEILISFPLKGKTFKYKLEEITGCSERFDIDKFGQYRTFNFSTNDNNIFQFSSREYRNYKDLILKISNHCSPNTLSFYKNLKQLLIYFVIAFVIVSLSLYISKII